MKNTIDKYKGLTFAAAADKLSKKYPNKSIDLVQKASFETELDVLIKHQDSVRMAKQMEDSLKEFKHGGMLPKYPNGGLLGDPTKPAVPLVDNPFVTSPFEEVPLEFSRLQTINSYVKSSLNPDLAVRTSPNVGENLFGATPPTINNSLGMSTPKDAPVKPREGMSAYTPALIGQGISTAINAGILSKGYDKVAPVDNPFESQIINNMASRGIDTTQQRNQILSAYNAAKEGLGNVRSANVQQALGTNLMNVTQNNLASSKLQEQEINNQYKGDFAQTLGSLGQQKVNASNLAEQLTAQNKGQFQSNVSAMGVNLADSGKFFTAKMTNDNYNKIMGDVLSNKYQNIGLNPEVLQRMKEGKSTSEDITKLRQAYGDATVTEMFPDFKFESK